MVNYTFAEGDPRLVQVRALAQKMRNDAISKFSTKGVAVGNVAGFDLEAYQRAVESGQSGTRYKAAALERAGQKQLYRSQPEVAALIAGLTNKEDVTSLEVSNARANSGVLKTASDVRNTIVQSHPDPIAVVHELTPISPEGLINMNSNNIAPIAHPLYEQQAVDDMVSNVQSSTATPDEAVINDRPDPMSTPVYGVPPDPGVYDGSIDLGTVEADDSSGTGFVDYQDNRSIQDQFSSS